MYRAIVLCPGPSLGKFPGREPGNLLIGVNRAATTIACAWWACGDHTLLAEVRESVLGTPRLFTSGTSLRHLNQHATPWRGGAAGTALPFEALFEEYPREWSYTLYTATAAAVLAAWLGATRIDVWGADLSGTKDWDGLEAGRDRSDERWRCEAGVWKRIEAELGERGVEIVRH